MPNTDDQYSKGRIFLYLLIVAIVVQAIGKVVVAVAGQEALTTIEITISSVLTAALVLLYFRQTSILESQHDLRRQELNREARQRHTETLRERVRKWHGNPDKQTPENPMEAQDRNTPVIKRVSFESAPNVADWRDENEEADFRVIPHDLEDDRYLDDLLENHATDLKETKERIKQLNNQFIKLRDQCNQIVDTELIRETDRFRLEPDDFSFQWLFEFLVMYDRGFYEDFDEAWDAARTELERGDVGFGSDEGVMWIRVSIGNRKLRAIYSAVPAGGESITLSGREEDAKEAVKNSVEDIFTLLEDKHPIEVTREAAEVLDEAQEAVDRLEQLLIEYDGRPIYPGDCKYLDEARISDR
jgi:hypothetical protein